MVFSEGGGGGSTQVGSASFGIGIDLEQFRRDLDRAEQLARERAARIQGALGNLPVGGGGGAGGGAGGGTGGGGGPAPSALPPAPLPQASGPLAPNRARGQQALNAAQSSRAANLRKTIGLSSELAVAVARGDVTLAEAFKAHGGGKNEVDSLLAQTRASQAPLASAVTGATEAGGAPALGISRAFATLQSARARVLAGQESPDADDPALQGRLYAARRQQESVMSRVTRARDADQRRQQQLWDRQLRRQQQELQRQERQEAAQNQRNVGVEAGLNRRVDAQGTTEALAPEDDPKVQGRLYQARAQQQRLYAQAYAQALKQGRVAPGGPQGPGGPPLNVPSGGPPPPPPPPPPPGPTGGSPGGGPPGGGGLTTAATNNLIRFGAALVGIPLGFNIAAGAARVLHIAIEAAVNATLELVQASRDVGISYGNSARAFTGAGAANFVADRRTRGSEAQYLQTAAALGPLAAQYQITTSQSNALITSEGILARLHGVELPQAGQVLQSVLRGNLEAGQALDLQLTNEYGIIHGVGLTWEQLVQAQGRARAEQTLLVAVQADVDRQLQNNATNADAAVDSFDRLSKAWDTLRTKFAQEVRAPVGQAANAAANVVEGASGRVPAASQAVQSTPPIALAGISPLLLVPPVLITAIGIAITKAIAEEAAKKLAENPPTAVPNLPTVPETGIAPPPISAAGRSILETNQSLTSPEHLQGDASAAQIAFHAQQASEAQAASVRAHQQAIDDERERQFRSNQARLPGLNAAGNSPPILTPAQVNAQVQGAKTEQDVTAATKQQQQAGVQANLAQARLDQLSAQADMRRLDVAGSINDLTQRRLSLQGELAPMLLREQSLQDQIRLTTRENLDLTENRLQAERSALPASQNLAGINFTQRQAVLRAETSIIDRMQGREPSFNISDQVKIAIGAAYQSIPAELADLEGQRGVQVAGYAQQADQLNKAIAAIPNQKQLQNLQLGPGGVASIQLALAANDASAQAIDRSLQLTNLMFSPQIVAAEQALADARVKSAAAAEVIANAQANAPGGIGPVSVTVNLPSLTIAPDVQSLVNQITGAAQQGVYDGLARAASLQTPRVDSNIAGARP